MNTSELIGTFVQIRDLLKEMEEQYQNRRKPLVDKQMAISALLQKFLEDNKMDSLKTEAGTCYVSTRTTASLADPDAFMRYVIENKAFDLLDRRANATAVKDFVQEHNNLPPGCNLNTISTVGVRRGSDK